MKVKLYQIIEDTSAELHSLHSVNGSWFGPQKIEDDSAVFCVFYKIVPRLFWSCHETDTDEWREGCWLVSISSDSLLKTPGQNPAWSGLEFQLRSQVCTFSKINFAGGEIFLLEARR